MSKVNLFVIGAAKAGTTSLASYFESHPSIFVPSIKEPCHFAPDINAQTAAEFKKQALMPLDRYMALHPRPSIHIHHVNDRADYDQLFVGSENYPVRADFSTNYMVSETAADQIFNYNPNAKVIAIIREPTSRIRSHYLMDWRIGLERRPLEECLAEEIDLGESATFENCRMYLAQTRYTEMLRRFEIRFPPSAIMIVDFHRLVSQQDTTMREILKFINLSIPEDQIILPKENTSTHMPKFKGLDSVLYKTGLKKIGRRYSTKLPNFSKNLIKSIYFGARKDIVPTLSDNWVLSPEIKILSSQFGVLKKVT